MPTTVEGRRLTDAHRIIQVRIAADVSARMIAAWPLLDPFNLDATVDQWLSVARSVVTTGRSQSVQVSAQYLRLFRAIELGTADRFAPILAEAVNTAALDTSLLVTGPVKVKQAIGAGQAVEAASQLAVASAAGAASRHALNGGRDTIDRTIRGDRLALGYSRYTRANCCSFCAMLASRGPVYKSAETATVTSRGRRYHDHCYCQPVPVYSRDAAWPGQARQFEALWQETTKGKSGRDAVNAFRRAYERP